MSISIIKRFIKKYRRILYAMVMGVIFCGYILTTRNFFVNYYMSGIDPLLQILFTPGFKIGREVIFSLCDAEAFLNSAPCIDLSSKGFYSYTLKSTYLIINILLFTVLFYVAIPFVIRTYRYTKRFKISISKE